MSSEAVRRNVEFLPRRGLSNCIVCAGWECHGGGNVRCLRRDPRPSRLAGILDTYGGLRFIVAHHKTMKHHVRHDETLIVVPALFVHEPIAWGDIPNIIARIELTVNKWIDEQRPNEPHAQEAVRMYRLRRLENFRRSVDLNEIVTT